MFELKAIEIQKILGGQLIGSPNLVLKGINRIEHLNENEISFVSSDEYLKYIEKKESCLVIANKDLEIDNKSLAYLLVDNAYISFVKLLKYIDENIYKKETGISNSAHVTAGSKIGSNPVIMNGVHVGTDCKIGDNVLIHPNVSILDRTVIGNNCIIHSGAVIGSDGFGYVEKKDGSYLKIPQLGNVEIGNNVEIGANTCIDRAIAGSTKIADGVKIDNLVHIAHNVEIGENSAFASQVGISGSVKIGKRVRMGGQAGSAGHLEIGNDITIMAQSGVAKSVEKPGIYFGSPIKPRLDAFKIEAAIKNLPEILKQINKLEKKIGDK